MLERLEKFRAPDSWTDLIPGAAILVTAILAIAALEATVEPEPKISQQAEAAERTLPQRAVLPLSHPLGCPEEDAEGRPLKGTLSIKGERRPRCYYGKLPQ